MATKQLRRLDSTGAPDDYPLPKSRYGIGLSWDEQPGRPKVDLDLQCLVVNREGVIVDCAYYNNLKAGRGIAHSGDETTGAAHGMDEMVWVTFPRLAETTALLIFVVAAYRGGQLKDVANGRMHLMEDSVANTIAGFEMEHSAASVKVASVMFRSPSGWCLRMLEVPAQQGQHFMDIMDLLAQVVRSFIPTAPARQKVAFAMEKGGVLDLPCDLQSITVGLGWDVADQGVDLDVSAVLLDSSAREVETVFFGRLESLEHGIKHSGDNLTGEGEGDDEQIVMTLPRIGARVTQVAIVINIYTRNKSFLQVANPYCRVVDNSCGHELCRYMLRDAGNENGLIVAKLAREAGDRWGFHALGLPCRGNTYKDSLPSVQQICNQDTRKFMARMTTSGSDGLGGLASTGSHCHHDHDQHEFVVASARGHHDPHNPSVLHEAPIHSARSAEPHGKKDCACM